MIGVGIDAVEVPRFRKVAARTPGIIDRLFTDAERAYCDAAQGPDRALRGAVRRQGGGDEGAWASASAPASGGRSRWCGPGRVSPSVVLSGGAAALAERKGVTGWRLSLTHTETMAEAVAVAL